MRIKFLRTILSDGLVLDAQQDSAAGHTDGVGKKLGAKLAS